MHIKNCKIWIHIIIRFYSQYFFYILKNNSFVEYKFIYKKNQILLKFCLKIKYIFSELNRTINITDVLMKFNISNAINQ